MTAVLLALALPCVYWAAGVETKLQLDAARVTRICVPPERVEGWRAAGVDAAPMSDAELAAREALPAPGVAARAGVASPTRAPWIVANGWRFQRAPGAKYAYDVPDGKGALAAAEAAAYGADVAIKADPADLNAVGAIMSFSAALPRVDLPAVADLAVVDDGSPVTGEVMNLLARRNLLFTAVAKPGSDLPLTIVVGSAEYPAAEAADPSAFALKVRRQLTDERRTVRIFGSEVVIARVTADATRARLHLLNYGGREIEGLRVRLRGAWREEAAYVATLGRTPLIDQTTTPDAFEFSLPRMTTYAVIDLRK